MSKPAKPFTFDGTDTSPTTIATWVFDVQQYLSLTDTPAGKQTRLAASYLGGTAKTWYIDTFGSVTPTPDLDDFLSEFKEFFTSSTAFDDAFTQVEHIEQGKLGTNTLQNSSYFSVNSDLPPTPAGPNVISFVV